MGADQYPSGRWHVRTTLGHWHTSKAKAQSIQPNKLNPMKKMITMCSAAILMAGCGVIVKLTDSKKAKGEYVETPISKEANAFFWDQFHQGNYDSIAAITAKLNLALAADPNDLVTTAHLGFLHVWALSERQRLQNPKADITEHLLLSKRYFEEAHKMNPNDPRLLGFLADMTIAEGNVLQDRQLVVDGYFKGLKSIRMWPQFNQFSIGYVFSVLDTTDANFDKAIEWQYRTIEDCACEKIERNGDYEAAVNKIKYFKDPKIARACWNSWIAPHNWEGFCLNFGDMLTKKGDVEEAKKIYNLARLSDTFEDWPHKEVLEERLRNMKQNTVAFNEPVDELNLPTQSVVLFNSQYSCVSCHQMGKQDQVNYSDFKGLGKQFYFQAQNGF